MWILLTAAALALALAIATAAAALALYAHTSRRRATAHTDQPDYQPTSVEPRGRWRISRLGDDLLEPATYRLNTNPDGPPGDLPPPLYPAPEGKQQS